MDFEDAKENIQPLAAGRNASILQAALHTESPEELQQQRRQYEDAIENYEGDDPLEPWFEYIYWIEQSFPSGGKESGLEEVLIKCLTKFEKDLRYHQDRRMIKLYIKYVDTHEKPQECYYKLYHQGIGTMVADLYICWAYYYDLNGDFRSADKIFRMGIECKAQPFEELQEAHQHFGFTMSQRILYNDDQSKEKHQSSMQEKRNALTSLKSHRKQVGSIRTGNAVKRNAPGIVQVKPGLCLQNQNSIQVFNEENLPCSIPSVEFAGETSVVKTILNHARNQENVKEAGPWSKACANKKKLFTSEPRTELGFEILEDQEEILPIKGKINFGKPFVYLDNFVSRNEPQEYWNLPVTLENESVKGLYPSYDKCLIYPKPNTEFSLEELGCYYWCKRKSVENKFSKKYDTIWKNNINSGVRLYPNFAKNSALKDEMEPISDNSDLFECFTKGNSKLVIDLKLCYPSESENEFQLEEILHQRWKSGKKKFKYDCNETIAMVQEMEETICMPKDGARRKSFFPNRKSMFPLVNNQIDSEQPKLKQITEELPGPSMYRKSILKTPNLTGPQESNKVIQFYENSTEHSSFAFKNSSSPAAEQQKNNFEIFEDEELNFEANESCSTQVFNCFIKPHSISTPKGPSKVVKLTNVSERQPTNEVNNIPVSANQNNIPTLALSPEYNDAGNTLRGKQLSTIMETSEQGTGSTGSTKFSINVHDFEVDVQQSRMILKGNICNVETVDKNQSVAEKNFEEKLALHKEAPSVVPQHSEISFLEQPEETVPTMPVVKIFEDKTETVPKLLLTKMRTIPEQIEEKENINCQDQKENFPCSVSLSKNQPGRNNITDFFFETPTNSEHLKSKPTSPPAAIINNSIFTSSAFIKFQDSPTFNQFNQPELLVKNSSLSQDTKEKGMKNKSLDSLFLPNLSNETVEKSEKQLTKELKKTMENSFIPAFSNNRSIGMSPEKIKSTKVSFLAGFPSFAVGENKHPEDSFVSYLLNTSSKKKQSSESNSKKTCDYEKILEPTCSKSKNIPVTNPLVSFKAPDCSFMLKEFIAEDDKGRNKETCMLNFSPDLYTNSLLKAPNDNKDGLIAPKNSPFGHNLSTKATPKFQIHEDTHKIDVSRNMSMLCLEEPQTKLPTNEAHYSSLDKFKQNERSSPPQFKNFTLTEDSNFKKNKAGFPFVANSSLESTFKRDNFFEDNIRTEAFAVNLSMIKNSTLLPSHEPQQSQIKLKSINISDDQNDSFIPPTAPEDKLLNIMRPLKNSFEILESSNSQNKAQPSNEYIEIAESDEEPEMFGKSIYYTKTPKTPKIGRHAWSLGPLEEFPETVDYVVNDQVDMDQTEQIIDNICEARDVNPFNHNLIEAFLNQVEIISYIQNLPTCKLVGKVSPLKKDSVIEINGKVFNVIKLIGEGAFGAVYSAKESQTGKILALKQERPANLWEYYICLELQSRLHNAEMISGFAKIKYALIGNNASILFSKYSQYGSLIAVCNKIKKVTLKNVDEYVVMHMASQMLLIMDHLHASNIIHADIKPDNFLLMEKLVPGRKQPTIQLIDFGNSIDMNLFNKGQTFTYIHETDSFKCVEMLEKRPWTYQLDLFGLAGVIHVLLFGKYMELVKKPTEWTHRTHIPRYLKKSLWDVIFHSLLNIPDCQTMPNLQNLRAQLEEEIADNKIVCQKIVEFNRALDV